MKKKILKNNTDKVMTETKEALELLWAEINKGQQMQIIKVESIKELFDRYGVEYEE